MKSPKIYAGRFVKAWAQQTSYMTQQKEKGVTWLYKLPGIFVLTTCGAKPIKKRKASLLSEDMSLLLPGVNSGNITPDTIGLRKLVSSLRKEEQEVIELMYFKGFTQREIALLMNTPLGTVKTRMSRAIKNLRYYFKKDWKEAVKTMSLN